MDVFIDHLANKEWPLFSDTDKRKNELIGILKDQFPQGIRACQEEAVRICQHQFQLLGEDFIFDDRINWHLDPSTGNSWPLQPISKIDDWIRSAQWPGDIKLPWELSRHQYFFTLAKAYFVTGNENYARECAGHISDWIKNNPYKKGIHWFSPLEIALRLISWIIAFHIFKNSSIFLQLTGKHFVKSIFLQSHFLEKHLTLNLEVPNNHLIGEATALILVAASFPEFKKSQNSLASRLAILEQEIQKQTSSEGVNKEQSTSYQRFVLDFLVLVLLLSKRKYIRTVPFLEKYAEEMIEYLMFITGPDGQIPMVGDSDNGRGYQSMTCNDFWDFSATFAIGSILFNRSDFKYLAQKRREEVLWFMGIEGWDVFKQLRAHRPEKRSVSLLESGLCYIRDDWIASSDLGLMRCGEFGLGGEGFCAHAHCDLLSFLLWIEGKPVLIDSGTYSYRGEWRNYFRLTSAHNTLRIDHQEQAEPLHEFAWEGVPKVVSGQHDDHTISGCLHLSDNVMIRRKISHYRPMAWAISDRIIGDGNHVIEWFFHFHPALQLEIQQRDQVKVFENDWQVWIKIPSPDMKVIIEQGWVSANYGVKKKHSILYGQWQGDLSGYQTFIWEIMKPRSTSDIFRIHYKL